MKNKEKRVVISDKMQKKYAYLLSQPIGRNFHKDFKPDLSPKEMLSLGVFGGIYMRDCIKEFPKSWFIGAKFAPTTPRLRGTSPNTSKFRGTNNKDKRDPKLNYFGVNASQPLSVWQKKGWIYKDDPRGWFQWYCRYYMGRRIEKEDARQIKRWKAINRHIAQIVKNCRKGDVLCRPKQRQAVLHWAYDSRKF